MALLLLGKIKLLETWISLFNEKLPNLELRIWPAVGNIAEIDMILAGFNLPNALPQFPHLKLVISIGAGVDHILKDTTWIGDAVIVRLVAESLTAQMVEYVSLGVLSFQRRFRDYLGLQKTQQWQYLPAPDAASFTVGILGLGVLGATVAAKLKLFGFRIRGWSRTSKSLDGIECFYGKDQFPLFLSECRVLVCLLPLTPLTENILNLETFSALPQGAYLINVARGQHLVETDLITALNSGQIAGAWLDVFRTEPLPQTHPFWLDNRIFITPHIAAVTLPQEVISQVVDGIEAIQTGKDLKNIVDINRGY
ncbi:MAG: glyoxylate/hydroxypyruvate reductase A [Microcoleaceae cyanobacterium]